MAAIKGYDPDPERTPLLSADFSKSEFIESDPVGLEAGIKIAKLRKVCSQE